MKKRVTQILNDLERTRENLLDLSDEIWNSIDHNDMDDLRAGFEFKQSYNAAMSRFYDVADELSKVVQDFTRVDLAEEESGPESEKGSPENERIIRELDREQAHRIDEDFRYKRPYGFVLRGHAVKGVTTWRRLYERVLEELHRIDTATFQTLATAEEFESSHGNRSFASSPEELRTPIQVDRDVYAEVHYSANDIARHIVRLLSYFDLSVDEVEIYLREDRDAEVAE